MRNRWNVLLSIGIVLINIACSDGRAKNQNVVEETVYPTTIGYIDGRRSLPEGITQQTNGRVRVSRYFSLVFEEPITMTRYGNTLVIQFKNITDFFAVRVEEKVHRNAESSQEIIKQFMNSIQEGSYGEGWGNELHFFSGIELIYELEASSIRYHQLIVGKHSSLLLTIEFLNLSHLKLAEHPYNEIIQEDIND